MATFQPIDIGQTPNDDNGDPLRTAYQKINEGFVDVYQQIAQGLTIENALSETSVNAVQNQVLFAEFAFTSLVIKALQLTNVYQLPFAAVDYKRQLGNQTDASTVVYDKDLISANIAGSEYLLVKNILLSQNFYNNFFSQENTKLYLFISKENTERTVQRLSQFNGYLNTKRIILTGLDGTYSAFSVSDHNIESNAIADATNQGNINITVVKKITKWVVIDGYQVMKKVGTNELVIEVGDLIMGNYAANRFIIADVTILPYTTEENLSFYYDGLKI
ncbi:hypothetical protein [Aquimarina sp. Aq78]|uniref:hypothetical protein n=1 Tax=Aquimarina sp. Aq78 TaxID=1191889 RepID=UPI000D10272B|nr:hypothetical protein [Aquimarina sp. Aq78]